MSWRLHFQYAVRDHRLRCSLTQMDLAHALSVTQAVISRWENGKAGPTVDNLVELARVFNGHGSAPVSVKDLIGA